MGESCQRNYCHLRRVIAAAPLHLRFIAILIIFITVFNPVESTGFFEVRLQSFVSDFSHRGHDLSGCCSTAAPLDLASNGTPCTCPVSFRLCVKNYQASVDVAPPCVIGEYVTPVFDAERLSKPLLDEKPIVFYFNFTWPGSFSFVIEAFHQSEKTGERMLVSRFIAQRSVGTNQEWTKDVLTSNRTSQLELYYRVRCEVNYFEERCAKFCKPRDDKFGHYTCRENDGEIVCMPGWKGDYCTFPVCRPRCHKDNGHCSKPHECQCRSGWEGELCDTCSRYPGCEHGTCKKPWQCDCNEGWGGLFCNQDLNYCTNHKPCKNYGTCTNTGQGSYTCNCTSEFMGKDCDVLRNQCQQNPCQNGGICLNSMEGNYTCQCHLGFYGPNCETSASICTDNPCKNGGTCIDNPLGFSCICISGFFGSQCEQVVPSCTDDFCSYGGQCTIQPEGPHCVCLPGFSGKRCDEVTSCVNNPCQNGGHCYTLTNFSRCSCATGFSGTFCETEIDSCLSSPCQNGGKCLPLPSGFECLCELGFAGKNCSEMDSCSSFPCQNGGLCKAEPEGPNFSCHCPTGFKGNVCQFEVSIEKPSVKGKVRIERTHRPTASNISHQIMTEDKPSDEGSINSRLAIILSCSVVVLAAVSSCAIVLVVRFCCVRRQKPKDCEATPEDELKQNERNTLRMNNKCAVPQKKIVNILDRVPGKLPKGDAPAKVLNAPVSSSNKRMLEKNFLYAQRTLDRRDDPSGSDNSIHRSSQDWSPRNNGGVFIIQDHVCPTQALKIEDCYQARPPSLLSVEDESIFATEV